jgi:choline kinase
MNKVLITTSGVGSRLGEITKYTNKSLVRIGNKPVLSYIIDNYPESTYFVVTLGYFGEQVRDYLELAYPNRSFEYVEIDKYSGDGSSLLYSLLCAKEFLNEPFVYHACDTITFDVIPDQLTSNWIAGFKGAGSSNYASFSTLGKTITEVHLKGYINCDYLHVGLLGIYDHKNFWEIAEKIYNQKSNDNTIGDVDILKEMVHQKSFTALDLKTWHDMGNIDSLENTRNIMRSDDFHVLDKLAESIFKVDGSVIKFFYDKKILSDRVARVKFLNDCVPELTGVKENFYKYEYVKGDLFAKVANRTNFLKLIEWAKEKLWQPANNIDLVKFKEVCQDFYINKTIKRVNEFFEKKNVNDKTDIINGEIVPKFSELLQKIDINELWSDLPSGFHGDFILDNILIESNGSFKLIDWRQDFGGDLSAGDMYYDLAKLSHNLVVNHELIDHNQFQIEIMQDGSILVNIHRLQTLVECENIYFDYLKKNNYNLRKILILRSIIWLNMSPLHHHPFDLFLYYFGKYQLANALNYKNEKI